MPKAEFGCRRGCCSPKRNQNGDQTKEGRHVGLDFYDLLIEAIETAAEATKLSELSMERVAWRLREHTGHNKSER
jgi:hypothetical protein